MLARVAEEADFARVVRTAHGDAWQALGGLFEGRGGATATHHGVRLMASGLPHPQWNSADVSAVDADIAAAQRFYGALPWGVRVPAGMEWAHGRHLLSQRLMGLRAPGFRPAPMPAGLSVPVAGGADLDAVVAVDAAAFGTDADASRPWFEALLTAPAAVVTVACALAQGRTVAGGYAVATDAVAGPSVFIAAIAVLPEYRRRGFGAAVSSWLLRRGFDAGAKLAHLQPDDERAARLYGRLGFVETAGLDIYVDVASPQPGEVLAPESG